MLAPYTLTAICNLAVITRSNDFPPLFGAIETPVPLNVRPVLPKNRERLAQTARVTENWSFQEARSGRRSRFGLLTEPECTFFPVLRDCTRMWTVHRACGDRPGNSSLLCLSRQQRNRSGVGLGQLQAATSGT